MNTPNDNPHIAVNDDAARRAPRWLPATVVALALCGFVGLAWYAYTAGSHSVDDGDLVLVEADKTPVKEAPADPGGMKFPNQDKAIFGAITSGAKPAGVERVMPPPEEPVAKDSAGATQNLAMQTPTASGQEVLVEKPADQTQAAAPAAIPATPVEPAPVVVTEAPAAAQPSIIPKVDAHKAMPANAPSNAKPSAKPASTTKTTSGGSAIQLGAYRSEAEASSAWSAIKHKHSALSGLQPDIIKADLGDKGIYYRLRLNVANAKDTCASLSASGQACIVVK